MAEERFCPHCGRANPKAMPRCMNCGQRIVKGGISGMMLLEEEATPDAINRAPWWQTDPGSAIPPPPQVREEVARVEAKQRDVERRTEEERRFQERVRSHESSRTKMTPHSAAARTEKAIANCGRCGSPTGEAGAVFSFCLNCGADVSAAPVKPGAGAQQSFTQARPGYQSTFQTHEQNQQQTFLQNQIAPQKTTNPTTAAVFSFFIPGVGQMMNGQMSKGILMLLASVVFTILGGALPAAGLIRFAVSLIAAIDAYRIAERKRNGKNVRLEEWDLG